MLSAHIRKQIFCLIFLSCSNFQVLAQSELYELGRRLRAVETVWDEVNPDLEFKKKIVPTLDQAVRSFLSGRLTQASVALDEARLQMIPSNSDLNLRRMVASWSVIPETRLVDAKSGSLKLILRTSEAKPSVSIEKIRLRLSHQGVTKEVQVEALPMTIEFPLSKFTNQSLQDAPIEVGILSGEDLVTNWSFIISRVPDLESRLKQVRQAATEYPRPAETLEQATVKQIRDRIEEIQKGASFETDIFAGNLLTEAEGMISAIRSKQNYFSVSKHLGKQHWIAIPSGPNGPILARLQLPEKLDKPTPILITLHGAGGTENLFFEGYGNGITAKECQKRGWMMLAPRSGGFLSAPDIKLMLQVLKERYPIDPDNVFVIGHSMGAAQTIAVAQQTPNLVSAVVALGGGGSIRKPEVFQNLPFYIGCGKLDFALTGARSVAKALQDTKPKRFEFREYDQVEHLLIVREAMPNVMRFLDSVKK
jgi:predicted esterase